LHDPRNTWKALSPSQQALGVVPNFEVDAVVKVMEEIFNDRFGHPEKTSNRKKSVLGKRTASDAGFIGANV
jgi:hypothetical protein